MPGTGYARPLLPPRHHNPPPAVQTLFNPGASAEVAAAHAHQLRSPALTRPGAITAAQVDMPVSETMLGEELHS